MFNVTTTPIRLSQKQFGHKEGVKCGLMNAIQLLAVNCVERCRHFLSANEILNSEKKWKRGEID